MMRRPGLWVTNGHPGNSVSAMLAWRPGAITCLYDHLGVNQIFQYKMAHPDAPIIVRFPHPRNWQQNPAFFARQLGEQVASKWNNMKVLDPYVYFANEMNLYYENGDGNPNNQPLYTTREFYQKYANWVRMTADIIKTIVPEMKLITPPFAYGHGEDGAPDDEGHPKEGWAGYDYLYETVRDYFDNILTFHSYWGHAGGSERAWLYDPQLSTWYAFRWRRVLKLFETRYNLQAKMIIDEAGNFAVSDPDFTDQIMYHAEKCLNEGRVIAVTYFLWLDGTNSPGNLPNSWLHGVRDLGAHLTRLQNMPDVPTLGPDPRPPISETTIRVLLDNDTVQTMPLEEYLRAVVPAEIPALWSAEAVKAQAVAARSYAQYAIEHPRHNNADICASPAHCQHYDPAKIHPKSDEAIAQTKGVMARYNGQTVNGIFSANCGGHTRNNEDVFGGAPVPYLRGVPCPNKGEKRGHGVGFCQYGARTLAQQGRSYQEIIRYYYTGVTLTSDQDLTPSPSPPEAKPTVMVEVERTPGLPLIIGDWGEANAKILIRTPSGKLYQTFTGGKPEFGLGGFEIYANEPGMYNLEIETYNVDVAMTGQTTRLTFRWQYAGVVEGILRNHQNQPVANRRVNLVGDTARLTTTTDQNGYFLFEKLPTGEYLVTVDDSQIRQKATITGRNRVALALKFAASPGLGEWQIKLERGAGLPLLVGDIGLANRPILLTMPSGRRLQVASGSKPEFGLGGFEIYATEVGNYVIEFEGQRFIMPMNGQFTKVMFTKSSDATDEQVRLISEALPRSQAEAILQTFLQTNPDAQNLFEIIQAK